MNNFIAYCKKLSVTIWIIVIFICINILGTLWFSSITFDATENERFTISDASIEKIQNLSDPIHMKLYSSDIIASGKICYECTRIGMRIYPKPGGHWIYRACNHDQLNCTY